MRLADEPLHAAPDRESSIGTTRSGETSQGERYRTPHRACTRHRRPLHSRIQGALNNVGHRVVLSRIARILKAHSLPPVPERPTSWETFFRAHKDAIAGAPAARQGRFVADRGRADC